MVGLPFDPAVSVSGCRARADGRTRRCLELRGQLVVLEERVGQGNGMDVLGHVRRDDEAHRHVARLAGGERLRGEAEAFRSEEHTSELQSLMRISYAVFCLKKKKKKTQYTDQHNRTSNKITKKYTS